MLGASPWTIRANASSGQCQRYSGKLIKPIATATRVEKILLLIILYSTFSKSQNIFSLKSSDDDLPIKYAHIFANNKIISSSDSLGNFIINKNHLNSIIKITALGYKTLDRALLLAHGYGPASITTTCRDVELEASVSIKLK